MVISASHQPPPSLQHEWEACSELLLCAPARLSLGTPHLPLFTTWYFRGPPAVEEGGGRSPGVLE